MSAIPRAEVVGSLLRPAKLLHARAEYEGGRLGAAAYKKVEDAAVDAALELQIEAGLDVLTDGELRRHHFADSLVGACEGFARVPAPARYRYNLAGERFETDTPLSISGRLRRTRSVVSEEFAYLRGATNKTVKITVPSPTLMCHYWSPRRSGSAYPDFWSVLPDAVAAIREEIVELRRLGCTNVQIDAPELATLVDEEQREHWANVGIAPDRLLSEGRDALNAVADVPGMRFALHLCRGNQKRRWAAAGGYERLAGDLLSELTNYETLLLEYDDERSGGFEPLRQIPDNKVVVLGLVSTKRTDLEDARDLERRVRQASVHFPLARLAISTQCGFGANIVGDADALKYERAKLKLVAEVAARVWGGRSGHDEA